MVSARIISRIVDAIAVEEHVLGARKADARRAERDGVCGPARVCRHWCGLRAA